MLDPSWAQMLQIAWPQLTQKGRVCVPPGLPHPSVSGFSQPWVSEPSGQVADWIYSLSDGSRIHAHEFADGSIVLHRDALDPNQGIGRALGHIVCETTLGRVAVLALIGAGIAIGLGRLGFGFRYVPYASILPP